MAVSSRERGRRDDAGVALVWGLALVQVLLVVGVVVLAVGAQVVARQQAAAAADIAALVGAQAWPDACDAASASARANGASLAACSVHDGDVAVTVSMAPPTVVVHVLGLLGRSPQPVTATARAGPPSS